MKIAVFVTLALLGTLLLTVGVSYLWSVRHPHRITTTHEFAGTPAQVWSVLTDTPRYGEWNPTITESTGAIIVGGRLENTVRTPDGELRFTPTILAADPGRELRWVGQFMLPGLADGEHFFVIDDLGAGRVRLTHGETFTGALVPFAGKTLDMADQFELLNVALAQRVATLGAVPSGS